MRGLCCVCAGLCGTCRFVVDRFESYRRSHVQLIAAPLFERERPGAKPPSQIVQHRKGQSDTVHPVALPSTLAPQERVPFFRHDTKTQAAATAPGTLVGNMLCDRQTFLHCVWRAQRKKIVIGKELANWESEGIHKPTPFHSSLTVKAPCRASCARGKIVVGSE